MNNIMEQENINIEIPVIAKRGRGRPFKIIVPVVDVIPKEKNLEDQSQPRPDQY